MLFKIRFKLHTYKCEKLLLAPPYPYIISPRVLQEIEEPVQHFVEKSWKYKIYGKILENRAHREAPSEPHRTSSFKYPRVLEQISEKVPSNI